MTPLVRSLLRKTAVESGHLTNLFSVSPWTSLVVRGLPASLSTWTIRLAASSPSSLLKDISEIHFGASFYLIRP